MNTIFPYHYENALLLTGAGQKPRITASGISRRNPLIWIIYAIYSISYANFAAAEIYYVSPEGSNKQNGTSWETAWRTPAKAAATAQAGDTVIIRYSSQPYDGFKVIHSGEQGRPITFKGEDKNKPPVFSGAKIEKHWLRTRTPGTWKLKTGAKPSTLIEDGRALAASNKLPLKKGSWSWQNGTLYYSPSNGTPQKHTVWRPSRGGGILIRKKDWITVQDIECRIGNGACITIDNGNYNTITRITSQWYWRGVNITNKSLHNTIEDCLVQYNREGIYILRNSSYNTVKRCRALHNGNLPAWTSGDRAGIAIGESGENTGNSISECEIAYNGGPDSDPGLIAYKAPHTALDGNHVHHNYGSGIYVTIESNNSTVSNNRVHNNGKSAVSSGRKGIAALSVRRSRNVTVENNVIKDNHVSQNSPWVGKDLGPRGGLDVRGLPHDNMQDILLRSNAISGTIGGPDIYIHPYVKGNGVTISK